MTEQPASAWPELHLSEWKDTFETLHLWTQVVGKIRLELSPLINHWWNVPLYVNARGLTTSPMPFGSTAVEIQFDFLRHVLEMKTCEGDERKFPLEPMSVADFYRTVFENLEQLGIKVKIWPVAVELPTPIRLDTDREHHSYQPEYAQRFWRILLSTEKVMEEFRSGFLGKASPVHFFWGSFDLAHTRFSGRRAPERPGADPITREAYSHEVISAGWWPGGGYVDDAAFYVYAAPEPPGFREARVRPEKAFYDLKAGEFFLMYEDVRRAPSPETMLMEFLQSTYEAGARLGNWNRSELERGVEAEKLAS